jgi:transposase
MIAYCVRTADGRIVREGEIEATRAPLQAFGESLGGNCAVGLEATICSHWIYNFLKPYSRQILMAQPAKLKALQPAKNKNDELDTRILADLLLCNLFPECYVLPVELERLRRQLRYRALMVREQTLFKNKTAGLLTAVSQVSSARESRHRGSSPS